MRIRAVALLVVMPLWMIPSAGAQSETEQAQGRLYKTFSALESTEPPLELRSGEGHLTFIGAPPSTAFETETSKNKIVGFAPGNVAIDFVREHGAAFGEVSDASYAIGAVQSNNGMQSVRLNQSYAGLPVFGGQMVVQVGPEGAVHAVMSDIMRDASAFEDGEVSPSPSVTADEATTAAIAFVANREALEESAFTATTPILQIFEPGILGVDGATRLVWSIDVSAETDREPIGERVFVDAHAGAVVFRHSTVHSKRERQIYDARNTESFGILVREEGDDPVGIRDVDDAYTFLGNTYDFYSSQQGRDGIDDAGGILIGVVRFGQNFSNAFWDGFSMTFGDGWAVDDITSHELTHGVTEKTSNLIYFGESGAINESLSDMWGEFVDQTNNLGNDTSFAKWRVGEDLPIAVFDAPTPGYGIRNMKNPTEFSWFPPDAGRELVHPDRYNHPDFYRGFFDNGGVHINSGVGNKLCYLLTDGDTFNGQVITGMGIPLISDLFYATQFIMGPGSGYRDLYAALGQASATLGLTRTQRINILNATKAVEIAPLIDSRRLNGFRAVPAMDTNQEPVIVLSLDRPAQSTFRILGLVRKEGSYPTSESDGTPLPVSALNSANAYVDTTAAGLREGRQYFYSLFWDSGDTFPGATYARATAGADVTDFKTEIFQKSASDPFDLEFTQILFSPSVNPRAAEQSGQPASYVDFTNYTATIRQNVSALPIPRRNAFDLPMADDDVVFYRQLRAPVPFFGRNMSAVALSANGYLTFGEACEFCFSNFPSLDSHANDLRISFLFSDLDPSAGGSVWSTELDDRFVVTFENVPEGVFSPSGRPTGNTVQVEVFFSGHIRMTYLEIGAENAIVGLSDGNGIPADPSDVVPGSPSELKETDFSSLESGDPARLTLWPPVPVQFAVAGQPVEFSVQTNSPNGIPAITATWDRNGVAPLADNRDGTATFRWNPTTSHVGTTSVTIAATFEGEGASMTVPIHVSDPNLKPEARELMLSSGEDGEDPAASRDVDTSSPLRASYTYFHPDAQNRPGVAAEGQTEITWYKNGTAVTGLTGSLSVSPSATRIGDQWYFSVRPRTTTGVTGTLATSPVVTVGGNPIITGVFPAEGAMVGGTTVRITGRRLSGPLDVQFGGIDAVSIISRGDEEIEVVTPLHREGAADILVSAIAGTTIVEDGYRFVTDAASLDRADVNRDGVVDAVDVRLVANAILAESAEPKTTDANVDGKVNSTDLQFVVNAALIR